MPFVEAELIFDIKAEVIEIPLKRSFFLTYSGNAITPIGFKIGLMGKTGFYLESRMSIIDFRTNYYSYEDSIVKNYDKLAYYQFNDFRGYSAFYIGAGFNSQRSDKAFFYAGIGYYMENFLYQIDEISYNNQPATTSYVKDVNYSSEGLEIDVGMKFRFNKFIITGGLLAYDFENVENVEDIKLNWTAGIGFSL